MKHILLIAMAILGCTFSACASESEPEHTNNDNKVLTVYFSATGTTKGIAEKIHNATGGEILRIEPEVAYTSADLDYNSDCRANREQNDPSARPAIKTVLPDMADYNVVFLGYPIWWGKAPKIIYTLLESADFSGKTIIPFCTSGSSGIGGSEPDLHALVPDASWVSGRRFASSASQSSVTDWVNSVMPETNNNIESNKISANVPTTYFNLNGTLADANTKGIVIEATPTSAKKTYRR